jgi:hypothetical protein
MGELATFQAENSVVRGIVLGPRGIFTCQSTAGARVARIWTMCLPVAHLRGHGERRVWPARLALLLGMLFGSIVGAAAQEPPAGTPGPVGVLDAAFTFVGPPLPVPPAVIVRSGGQATIRAVPLITGLRLDGQLDEPVFAQVPAMTDFVQQEPQDGAPATERTEIWLLFDDDYMYVVARCWETEPERMIANEMRRDNFNIIQNEAIAFSFDTFYDRRNSVIFHVTPLGGRMDGQATNERQWSSDWNPIWDVAVGTFDGGWTMEAAIPFKSLRYRPGRAQVWGFNARRYNRWKNELSYLVPVPPARGLPDIMQASRSASVVGIEAPAPALNLDVKPYVTSNLTSDLVATPSISNAVGGDVGVDVKYALTQNLTADLTYNTDFAQVEADEQQINLTRFNLRFPEKREFFLENQGIFAFGGASGNGSGDTPTLFYSRRIGLAGGRAVPIRAGGRLTGRSGSFSIGALNIQSKDEPLAGARSTNFSVLRVRRDLLRRSSVGVIATSRSRPESGEGRNLVYGVDGAFAFFDSLTVNTYWARTETDGPGGDDTSYRVQVDYAGDRYGVELEHLVVGDQFNPAVGFLRRDDMRRSFAELRFSPRPVSIAAIRKVSWTGAFEYVENLAGQLETRARQGTFGVEFENSDTFSLALRDEFEFLPRPFRIASGITLPVGGYDGATVTVGYNFGQQRRVSGNVTVEHGAFFGGHRTALSVQRGRLNLGPQLSVEPSYVFNQVDLAEGQFATHLLGSRVTYTMTPLMFTSALVQYNSSANAVTTNVRLRWEYRPGSELFIVYNEQRDTRTSGIPTLSGRALVVKVNRLFRL